MVVVAVVVVGVNVVAIIVVIGPDGVCPALASCWYAFALAFCLYVFPSSRTKRKENKTHKPSGRSRHAERSRL